MGRFVIESDTVCSKNCFDDDVIPPSTEVGLTSTGIWAVPEALVWVLLIVTWESWSLKKLGKYRCERYDNNSVGPYLQIARPARRRRVQ